MLKILGILTTTIVTSMFLYPFAPVFLFGANTKQVLAAMALVILLVELSRKKSGTIDKDFMFLFIYSLLVSLSVMFSVFYNNTTDYTYVTYSISMLVWTAGAFAVVCLMRYIHGYLTVPLVVYYLAGVCVMQCVLAFLIDRYPLVESYCSLLDQNIPGNLEHSEGRLFGVGCAFDVGGMRMACVLVMMGVLFPHVVKEYNSKRVVVIIFLLLFLIISIIGNMIARTTSIGLALALGYMTIYSLMHMFDTYEKKNLVGKWLLGLLLGSFIIVPVLYRLDADFHRNLRFAFEGFFSLVEKGRWEVHSNDILVSMYRWPETFKTWIIGDGYFYNTNLDPYYTGRVYTQYYMATDVGYVRFIYYAGIVCMGMFSLFMCKAAAICANKFTSYKFMFILLLALQFLIWGKVASDVYAVFAIFIAMGYYMEHGNNVTGKEAVVD